jgi:hypothetical protein
MKSTKRKSTKQKILDAKPDEWAFKNLNYMNIKQEHRSMLGKFIIEQGYKIAKGKGDKTFAEVYDLLNESMEQLKRLQQSYGK